MENKKTPTFATETPPGVDFTDSPGGDVVFDYTRKANELQREQGIDLGRPSIERDTPVEGGVYWGSYGGEAIVVDGEKYPEGINKAMERVYELIRLPDGQIDKTRVLQAVLKTVNDMMRYDGQAVQDIFTRCGGRDFTKISLNTYIMEGVGVCRHQALFAAQILERLKGQGVIRGLVSVDRNLVRREGEDEYDGHAWVRYTNSSGEVFIIDPTDGCVDTLSNLMEKRKKDNTVWDYARPGDRERLQARRAGRVVKVIEDAAAWGRPVESGRPKKIVKDANYADGVLDSIPVWE